MPTSWTEIDVYVPKKAITSGDVVRVLGLPDVISQTRNGALLSYTFPDRAEEHDEFDRQYSKLKTKYPETKRGHIGRGFEGLKTKLDLLLDRVASSRRELTIDTEGYTKAQVDRVIATAEDRGLHAAYDGRFVLVRAIGDLEDLADRDPRKPRGRFALVRSRGFDDIVVSTHAKYADAEKAMRKLGYEPGSSMTGGFWIAEVGPGDSNELVHVFRKWMIRPRTGR